jgi:flagellar hook assembly protein FlgD
MLITESGKLNIEVYNINGQLVANPMNDYQEEGIWQGEIGANLPSGFYFVRASINQQSHTLKFIKE